MYFEKFDLFLKKIEKRFILKIEIYTIAYLFLSYACLTNIKKNLLRVQLLKGSKFKRFSSKRVLIFRGYVLA